MTPISDAKASALSAILRPRLLGLALAGLVIAQQLLFVPGDSVFDRALHNAFHLPWFLLVTLLLRVLVGTWWSAILAATALSVVSEGVQLLTGREPSVSDLLRNGAGAGAAWCLWQVASPQRRALERLAAAAMALALASIVFAPVADALASKQFIHAQFPVLLAAEDPRGRAYARPTSAWRADAEGIVLRIDDSTWPGLHLTEPVKDWSECSALLVDVTLDAGEPVDLFIGFLLKPGDGITNFSLHQLRSGRQQVRMPLTELLPEVDHPVHDVFLYTTSEYTGRELAFHRVWLD